MFVSDTNVLLYAVNASAREHARCLGLVNSWREGRAPWYLTWGIIFEFLRVATHPRVFPEPLTLTEAWAFASAIIDTPSVSLLIESKRHARVAATVFEELPQSAGNFLFDSRTAILMREHGVNTIYTRDTHFNRFPWLEVIDPVTDVKRRS